MWTQGGNHWNCGKINEYSGAGGVRDTINVKVKNVECKFLAIILAVCIFRDVPLMI